MLDYTASACNNCGHVANKVDHAKGCPCCKSSKGATIISQAPIVGIHA
jgi:predicted Zn-ribbon and HTH transcriptional regulator